MAERRYHHGDLRSALLDVAEVLIRERGADGWSLREASVRLEVSPSAAYHHFDSRDALTRALSDRVLARLGDRLGRAARRTPDGGQQRLIAVARSYVRWALEDPAIARLTFGAGRSEPGTPISPHPHDVVVAELDRLVDDGDPDRRQVPAPHEGATRACGSVPGASSSAAGDSRLPLTGLVTGVSPGASEGDPSPGARCGRSGVSARPVTGAARARDRSARRRPPAPPRGRPPAGRRGG